MTTISTLAQYTPYNDLLFELYHKSGELDPWVPASGWKEKGMLDLLRDQLVLYRDRTNAAGETYMVFAASQACQILMRDLPDDYKNNPYAYHLEKKAQLASEEATFKKKTDEKLEIDLKNALRVYRSYWWTFAIAIVGFLLSVILGIMKIFEHRQ